MAKKDTNLATGEMQEASQTKQEQTATKRITVVRPEGESASAQRVSVNGRHYIILYDTPTVVPMCVLAALQDAQAPAFVDTKSGGESVEPPTFATKARFTVIVHE